MKRIVVADDEFDLLDAIEAILAGDGYEVVACDNGVRAIEAVRAARPDLVLLDVMMPLQSGLEVLRTIRADPKLDGLPVILMSAVRPAARREDLGWDDFLKKPFTLDALVRAVRGRIG